MKLLGLLVAAGMLLAPTAVSAAPDSRGCATTTPLGKIAGKPANGLCVYSGIPYAAAPTGDLRFRPPRPASPWQGTFQANDKTKVCPQFRDRLTEEYPDNKEIYTDEDCLHLNVWAPKSRGKHPVIVFSHGGAARFGTGNEPRYDGTTMAVDGDAVVVTLNYRLGMLGWSELGGVDPSYEGSGNNGVRDQMAALEWVQANIAAFGGDPRNVTAVGQSEGAFSLSAMLATANPQHLFRRVVLESGSGYMVHSAALQRSFSSRLNGLSMAELKTMSPAGLLELQEKVLGPGAIGGAIYFGPYIDGKLIKGQVVDQVQAGNARGIDILAGSNKDEMKFFAQFDPTLLQMTQKDYDGLFPKELAAQRSKMIETYEKGREGQSESEVVLAMGNDQAFRVPATRLAEAQNRWGRAYVYQFNWAPKNAKSLGAIHAAEMTFAFGTHSFTGNPGAAEDYSANPAPMNTLSKEMVAAWTSFARTGNPGWPRYCEVGRATKIWDTPSRIAFAPREPERAAWNDFDFPALDVNF